MRVPDTAPARFLVPGNWGPRGMLDWRVRLNPDVPLTLHLETGASATDLDLQTLKVTEFKLNTGASSNQITLPAQAGYTLAEIKSGAAAVNVRVPADVAARIQAQGGLASIDIDTTRFPRTGSIYQSPDYDTAANKVKLRIETGVGAVSVR